MAEIWKPKDIKVYRDWYDQIVVEVSDELTDWETNFIESIGNRLDQNKNLTQGQAETLEKIYAERTG